MFPGQGPRDPGKLVELHHPNAALPMLGFKEVGFT